jgi:hypothetical protein
MPRAIHTAEQFELPIMGTFQARGDGTFTMRPRLPDSHGETWIKTRDALRLSGQSASTLYRWAEVGLLTFRRPTPTKWEFELGSLQRLLHDIRDPEFWTRRAKEAQSLRESRR